jgi:hypothetical protein
MKSESKNSVYLFSGKHSNMDSEIHIFGLDIEPVPEGNFPSSCCDCLPTLRAVHTLSPAYLIVSRLNQKRSIKDRNYLLHAIESLRCLKLDNRGADVFLYR